MAAFGAPCRARGWTARRIDYPVMRWVPFDASAAPRTGGLDGDVVRAASSSANIRPRGPLSTDIDGTTLVTDGGWTAQ